MSTNLSSNGHGVRGYVSSFDIEVFDNEDGSFYSICPICGANALAWGDDEAANEIMSHIHEEHWIEGGE